jgi:hypothetical protein
MLGGKVRAMSRKPNAATQLMLLAALLVGSMAVSSAQAPSQSSDDKQKPSVPAEKATVAASPSRNQPPRLANRARMYYGLVWGIDSPTVKWAESGELVRFTYRVVDAEKAKALNDKKAEPMLIDPKAGVSLVVPSLEKVGQLRQSSTPEAGKSYWMAFSNQGRKVKRGDRVNIVIGNFHADGLEVE